MLAAVIVCVCCLCWWWCLYIDGRGCVLLLLDLRCVCSLLSLLVFGGAGSGVGVLMGLFEVVLLLVDGCLVVSARC